MADRSTGAAWVKKVLGVELAQSLSERRGEEAKASNPRGLAYPKMLLRWRTAQAEAEAALARAGRDYLALENVKADPRYAEVQEAMSDLPDLLPEFGEELSDLLDKGINAGTDAGIAQEALTVIGSYRQAIGAEATLSAFEDFAKRYVGELAAVRTLDGALAEIANSLSAAA